MYENTTDPITLEPIRNIPKERLFKWLQKGKRYCADIESIYNYVKSGNTINPWAIDKASGHAEAQDKEAYLKEFDMARVRGLLKRIDKEYEKLEEKTFNNGTEDIPLETKCRFDIENICPDMYISHIVDFFTTTKILTVLRLIDYTLQKLYLQYKQQIENEDVIDDNALFISEAIQQCYVGLLNIKFPEKNEPDLRFVSQLLCEWAGVLDKSIMVTFFHSFSEIIDSLSQSS